MLESWIMDARYAARRLVSRPTYALLAVVTLALGAGGTAAIFSVARTVLLEPLPFRDEGEIDVFWMDRSWSEEEFLAFRPDFPGFRQVAAYRPDDLTLDAGEGPLRLVTGIASSAELFDVLGASPVIGRGFRPGDDVEGAEPVVVVSHGLWQELGGGSDIVGRRLRLGGSERTVVGVMPPGFWFPDPTVRIWTAAAMNPGNQAGRYTLVGRRDPGATAAGMTTALTRLTTALGDRFDYPPDWDKTRGASLTPVREFLVGSVRPALLATLGAMAVILLIAAANVAALMLGQVDSRSTELSVRAALGAGRRRLTQQLVIEAALVGVMAGAVGAALAAVGSRVLVNALPLGALTETAALDWTLLWVAIGIAIGVALVISIVPASAIWRGDLRDGIARARTAGVGGGGRMEGGLVVAQVALAVLLAAGAGLLVRSVANLRAIDPGVDTRGVAVVDVTMTQETPPERRRQTLRELVPALEAVPGVRTAAAVQRLPLRGGGDNWGVGIEGRPDLEGATTAFRIVTPGYFDAMGITIRRGRGLEASDRAGTERVVVINEALAQRYFTDQDPIGRRLHTGFDSTGEVIVGVVENVAEANLTDAAEPARYMLVDQLDYTPTGMSLVLALDRAESAGTVLDAARGTITRAAPNVAVQRTTTMESIFTLAVGPARQVMTLLTLLTALALVLGAVGIYGVISHFVTRRQRDYSIRIALGLAPSRVVSQVVGRGGRLVAAGSIIGVAGALLLARLLATFLYGVGATDPVAMSAAVMALLTVGMLAAFLPALRASRADPAASLREQ